MASTILYIASSKGVFTIMKNGGDWKVESQSLTDWSVPKIAVSPEQPNRIVAGTRGDGIWLSEDFGKKWAKPSYGNPGPGKVRSVSLHPTDPNRFYAGTEPIELFVSHDSGKTWKSLDSVRQVRSVSSFTYPVAGVEPHVREIVFSPKDPDVLYAALQVGYMIRSRDGGVTWTLLDQGLDADVHSICIHPEQSQRMYIATGGDFFRQGKSPGRALYMSENGGDTWMPIAMNFEEDYSVPLVMHPENPNIIYSSLAKGSPGHWRRPTGAECTIVRTEDGGKSWHPLDAGLTDGGKQFVEALVIDKAHPDRVYAGVRSGEIYASQDVGASWSKLNVKVDSISDMRCVHA